MVASPAYHQLDEDGIAAFLALLAKGHSVKYACKKLRYARNTLYNRRRDNSAFAEAWDAAVDEGADLLEEAARDRALKGARRGVWYGGKRVGWEYVPSDSLLMFLLRAKRPAIYDNGPIFIAREYLRQRALEAGVEPAEVEVEARALVKEMKDAVIR